MPIRILVVDDEAQIRKLLRIALTAAGYEVREAETAKEGVGKTATEQPDLVILDLGLPDADGREVVTRVREWSEVPILILSVRQAEGDKVAALDAGANDYVVKPFGVPELLARVRALLRRLSDVGNTSPEIRLGDLTMNVASHEVTLGGEPLKLTRKEFDLLRVLAQNAGRLMTHQQLLREVWGKAHEEDTQYLRVFVGQLRQKLGDDATEPRFILNEPGVGYRMLEANARS